MLISQTLFALAMSISQPTSDQVNSVFEHYWDGEGDTILADALLCSEIERKKKETKFDCITAAANTVNKGDRVNVYMTFLVPKGQEKELMVQATHNGVVRETRDVTVKGKFIRARTWKTFSLRKSGTWEFKIIDGARVLKTLTVQAE